MKCISSTRNPRIRQARKLRQRTQRRLLGHTLIEGTREITRALRARLPFHAVYLCAELVSHPQEKTLVTQVCAYADAAAVPVFAISRHVHEQLAMRGSTGGIVVEAQCPPASLQILPQGPDARYVVLEDADRPGNIGAVLRTAAATATTGVILAHNRDTGTDLANPNVIRASLGTLFTVPSAQASSVDTLAWLRARQCAIVACTPAGHNLYRPVSWPGPVAFIFGSEAHGLSSLWLKATHATVAIPMATAVDSLNLSVSVAVVLYEFWRRRQRDSAESVTTP